MAASELLAEPSPSQELQALESRVEAVAVPRYQKLALKVREDLGTVAARLTQHPPSSEFWRTAVEDWEGKNGPVGPALNRIISWSRNYDTAGAMLTSGSISKVSLLTEIGVGLATTFARSYLIPAEGGVRSFDKYFLVGLGTAAGKLPKDDPRRSDIIRAAKMTLENSAYGRLTEAEAKEINSPRLSRETANQVAGASALVQAGVDLPKELYSPHLKAMGIHLEAWQETLGGKPAPNWPRTIDPEAQGITTAQELREANDPYVKPFMAALTALAAARASDAKLPGAKEVLQKSAVLLSGMRTLWLGDSFPYMDRDLGPGHLETKNSGGLRRDPTPDLNGLIGSAYLAVGERVEDSELRSFGLTVLKEFPQGWLGEKQMNQGMFGFSAR